MATVAGIRFKKAGKVYYFDPTDVWPNPGDPVVVETVRGVEMGETVTSAREVPDETLIAPLKKIIRIATPQDVARAEECAAKEREALDICAQKIAAHKLDMKLVDAEYTFDSSKLIFYFTANGRVDFRDLVKDLASVFKMRIELRQIGVRDEAKMLGGLGTCGRSICCGTFLSDFQPVSIRMAKDQNLSLNPTKISGQCGRLMCCLKYEQDYYDVTLRKLPRIGKEIMTPDGIGIATEIAVIREKVKVRMRQPDDTYDIREYALDQVCKPGEALPVREAAGDADVQGGENLDPMPEMMPRIVTPRPIERKNNDKNADKPGEEAAAARRRSMRAKGKKQSTDQYFEKAEKGTAPENGAVNEPRTAIEEGSKDGEENN